MVKGRIAILERGDCTFVEKARKVQKAGAIAAIIFDNVPDTSITNQQMFAMSGDGTDDVTIPVVFLFSKEADKLRRALKLDPHIEVRTKKLFLHVRHA
jgi:mannosidase alpha-like ER degradation enhancer 3